MATSTGYRDDHCNISRIRSPRRRRKERKAPARSDNRAFSRKLKIDPTLRIMQKLYDGSPSPMEPPLPRPICPQVHLDGKKKGSPIEFAWQPVQFGAGAKNTESTNEEMYSWEYFMDGEDAGKNEFSDLFFEEGTKEYTYEHYYESSAYNDKKKKVQLLKVV
eukprot:1328684-Amorphochlora_amoeboformis.AAC.1